MKVVKALFLLLMFSASAYCQDYVDLAKQKLKTFDTQVKNKRYVIVIDYSKSIMSERLYVIDLKESKIVISSKVSHAFNSGAVYATEFSNTPGTNMSCIGAFVTEGEYIGSFGRSMIIRGLERKNSNARSRSIIFHSNKKMSTPWSKGCFSTSEEINNSIIDLTKGGCLVYVFN